MQYDILQGLGGLDMLSAAGDALIPEAIGLAVPVAAAVAVDKFLPTQAKWRHAYGAGASLVAAGITYAVTKNKHSTMVVGITGVVLSGILYGWEYLQQSNKVTVTSQFLPAGTENPPAEGLRGRYVEAAAHPLFAGRYQVSKAQPLFSGNGMGEVVGLGTNPGVFVSN